MAIKILKERGAGGAKSYLIAWKTVRSSASCLLGRYTRQGTRGPCSGWLASMLRL